ncbi:hypothetical protein ABMA32_14010 [Mesorhizobium sp. VNQ89]|uniref:hypothetical protein n=1 Tax=Mesorhizobium quangtriensis TaxID=3157709 RepID=UPI0032B8204B
MLNKTVQAAAEGMPNLNRRNLLAGLATAPVVALPAVAVAAVEPVTAQERLDAAIAELKAAASELWPDADIHREHVGTPGDTAEALPVMVIVGRSARVCRVPWSGPDVYECRDEKTGQQPIYWVEKTAKGYRCAHWWKGARQGGWLRYSESRLRLVRVLEG